MTTETVTYRTFNNFAKRVERATMKQYGSTTSRASFTQQHYLMQHGARIVETFDERKTITLEGNWRRAMVAAAVPSERSAQ